MTKPGQQARRLAGNVLSVILVAMTAKDPLRPIQVGSDKQWHLREERFEALGRQGLLVWPSP